MQTWMIDFQGMAGSRRLRAAIEDRIAELAQRHEAIMTCHVVAKGPQEGRRSGLHEVDIRLTLADGGELNVGRSPRIDKRYEEIDFAINDTFRRARRRLKDHLRGRTGQSDRVSGRPAPSQGQDAPVPVAARAQSDPTSADTPAEATNPPPGTGSPLESPTAVVSGDAWRDQDDLEPDSSPEPPATESAANDTEEPALAGETAAEPLVETASAEVAAPTADAPEQATNLSPLFMALAVGTALTAAVTLNASATWARLLKSAAAGINTQDDGSGKDNEVQRRADSDDQAAGN